VVVAAEESRVVLLEPIRAVAPGEDGEQDLPDLQREGVQHLPKAPPRDVLDLPRPLQLPVVQKAVADQRLTHAAFLDVGLAVNDAPLREADAAPLLAPRDVEQARLPPHVQRPQDEREYAFGERSLHYGTRATPHGLSPTPTRAVTARLATSTMETSLEGPLAV